MSGPSRTGDLPQNGNDHPHAEALALNEPTGVSRTCSGDTTDVRNDAYQDDIVFVHDNIISHESRALPAVVTCGPREMSEIETIRAGFDGGIPLLHREDRMARRKRAEDALSAIVDKIVTLDTALRHVADTTYPAAYLGKREDGTEIYGGANDASRFAQKTLDRLAPAGERQETRARRQTKLVEEPK